MNQWQQRWESCIYSLKRNAIFLNFLGPTLKRNGLHKNIVVWDHNRDLVSHRANTIFNDSIAMSYAWGIGFTGMKHGREELQNMIILKILMQHFHLRKFYLRKVVKKNLIKTNTKDGLMQKVWKCYD